MQTLLDTRERVAAEIDRLMTRVNQLETIVAALGADATVGGLDPELLEEALHAQERLAMAVESAGLAWWDHDFTTGRVVRSDSWARMLGYSPGDIEDHAAAWKELIHPDDRPAVEEAARRHESGEFPVFETEHRLRARDGSWRWILNWGRIVARGADGRPLRALGAQLDITRRKTAEMEKAELIGKLEKALAEIRTLRGIIPICASCKKIRDSSGAWNQLEQYIREHSEAEFSHGICPECAARLYPQLTGK